MTALILRADARALPLPDASVDLIVTSPPYWNLRSYEDGGEHYAGQIGSEASPTEFIAALMDCTREWMRVLKPTGSIFVNLGDAYANTATNQRYGSSDGALQRGTRPGRISNSGTGVRPKSLYGLPWRYALACIDEGLILRRDQIWHKTTALPESATDRSSTRHEYLFHLVTQEHYYSALDRIREPHTGNAHRRGDRARVQTWSSGGGSAHRTAHSDPADFNPLGRRPGSVWDIAAEPLSIPDHIGHAQCCAGVKVEGCERGLSHPATFPTELPRRVIEGWSPTGWCVACGQPRRPLSATEQVPYRQATSTGRQKQRDLATRPGGGRNGIGYPQTVSVVSILGERCGCPTSDAPVVPAVVVDPFGGAGTTALVADALGRTGITVDGSADYGRLAQWRIADPAQRAKALRLPKPPAVARGQASLFDDVTEKEPAA